MEIKCGATRSVFLFNKWAVKLPFTFNTNLPYRGFWYRILHGLLANMQEKEFSHVRYAPIPLLPVSFYIWGGLLVVMKRGEPISDSEFKWVLSNINLPPIVERKQDSFAKIDGVIYAIDYGS